MRAGHEVSYADLLMREGIHPETPAPPFTPGWEMAGGGRFQSGGRLRRGVLVMRLVTGTWQAAGGLGQVAELPQLNWLTGWLTWILISGLGEETGWRGFALLRLQARYSARRLVDFGSAAGRLARSGFFLQLRALAVFCACLCGGHCGRGQVLTWLYNGTGGSVLATILWHDSHNAVVAGSEGVVAAAITAAVILTFILIVRRYGPETLSHRPKHTQI